MFCPKCGHDIREEWDFCPKCGWKVMKPIRFPQKKPARRSLFSFDSIFDSLTRQMDDMHKKMEKDFKSMDRDIEVFNLKPLEIGKPKVKRSGFSITIRSGTGQKPVVNVQTFGKVDKDKLRQELQEKLGIPKQEAGPVKKVGGAKEPKEAAEPKTEIKRLPNLVIIETKLPEVKSERDISVKKYAESVELRAVAKEKLYFKIIQVPADWQLVKKRFKDGVLTLEFAP